MNKIALILALVSLCFSAETPAIGTETVHDNFKPAGLQIDGSGQFSPGGTFRSAQLAGRCGFFIWDGVQFSVSLGAYAARYPTKRSIAYKTYTSGKYQIEETDYFLITRLNQIYTKANIAYFWGYKRGKTDRLVHSVGMGVELGIEKDTPLKMQNDSLELAMMPEQIKKPWTEFFVEPGQPYYQLFWFITPTIAPNIKFAYDIESLRPIPDLSLGFSYFIPSKKLVLIHRKNKERRESRKEQCAVDRSTAPVADSTAMEPAQ